MKIKSYLCVGACLFSLMACSSNNSTGSKGDSVVADSAIADTAVSESAPEAAKIPTHLSDDLKKFGLKGHVSKVSHEFKGSWVPGLVDDDLTFDAEGKLTSKTPDLTLKTNSDGFINKVVDSMGSSDGSTATSTFVKLNEDGWPTTVKSEYDGPDSNGYANFTITYPEIDDHGNWTKCVIKGTQVFVNIDTDDEFEEPLNVTLVRNISY